MKKYKIVNEICSKCFLKFEQNSKKQVIEVEYDNFLYLLFFDKKELVELKKFSFNENKWDWQEVDVDVNLFNVVSILTKDLFENDTK